MASIDTLGIDKLRFFTGDGNEIQMEKQYTVEWEIVPSIFTCNSFLKNPKGHLELYNSNTSVLFIVDDGGLIKNKTSFTRYIGDEDGLFSVDSSANYNVSTDGNLVNKPQYVNFSYDAPLNKTLDDINDIIFFSYRATNTEDITAKQTSARLTHTNNGDITLQHLDNNYVTFTNSVSSETRIRLYFEKPVYVYIKSDTENWTPNLYNELVDVDKKLLLNPTDLNSSETTGYKNLYQLNEYRKEYKTSKCCTIESPIDGDIYISYDSTDTTFKAYRLSDRNVSNTLRITINSGSETVTEEFNLVDLLQYKVPTDKTKELFINENYTKSSISTTTDNFLDETSYIDNVYSVKSSLFKQVRLSQVPFEYDLSERGDIDENAVSALYYLMTFPNYEYQMPFVRYIGNVMQDKVSTNLISATTVIIASENNGNFIYPTITGDDNKKYQIHFKFQSDSEMFFVTSDDNSTVSRTDAMFMPLNSNSRSVRLLNNTYVREDAMHFTVGLESDREGCYQNTMGMFMREEETNVDYFLGIIIFNTEVIDEDERFRTLFQNFGIPDPIKYPNIFKSQDPQEEGTDWQLINQKSKELFLSYNEIFPYVGTYKALFNAIKYLGYEDIIFKEWYKIKDTNENNRYVAIQTYDVSSGNNIASVLKSYDVEYGEYERYTKLNRLSMVYHLNNISEDGHEEELTLYNGSTGVVDSTATPYYDNYDIPSQYNIYEYRNDEILAKLYSLKKWLEHYVTGVNCYISDINGEGIVLDRIKTIGYVTEHEFKDILNRGYFTPNTRYTKNEFTDSSAVITCSLNEFDPWLWEHKIADKEVHAGVTFNDYKDYSISQFIKKEHTVKLLNTSTNITVYDSCPIGALTVADEYEFVLNINNAESGSLYEFASNDSSNNPILINDGEITFFDLTKSLSNIEADEAPVILIKKGNLRSHNGSWSASDITKTNIKYSISNTIDANGNSYYLMTKFPESDDMDPSIIRCKANVTLSPNDYATLKYTTDNTWNVPLFEITNYNITNQMRNDSEYSKGVVANSSSFFDSSTNKYVLEIIEGEMRFSNVHKAHTKDCDGAVLIFGENPREEGGGEQVIRVSYTYKSERKPIYNCNLNFSTNASTFTDFKTCCSSLDNNVNTTNTKVDIPVNRIGDYKVQVNAYDAYNNIFTATNDDICTITSKMPDIDIVANQSNSENSSDFYRFNIEPDAMEELNASILIDSVDSYIKFPINYRIHNVRHNLDDSLITYDNISYAIDTPKENDYVMLTNLTEFVKSYYLRGSNIVVTTNAGNIGKQNFITGNRVALCVYDDNLHEVLWKSEHLMTIQSMTPSVYTALSECTLTLSISPDDGNKLTPKIASLVNDSKNNVNMYILSTPYLDIPNDCEIINYYDSSNNRRCFIPINEHSLLGDFDSLVVNNNMITIKYTAIESTLLSTDTSAYVLVYDYNSLSQRWLSNKLTVESKDDSTKTIVLKDVVNVSIGDDIINDVNTNPNVRVFVVNNLQHIDDYVDAFEDNFSEDITLRHFPIDTMVKVRASIGDNVINETAYRVLDTSIYNYINNNNPTKNVIKCGYILDGHIDLNFIQDLRNRNVYKNSNTSTGGIWKYDYLDNIKFTMMPLHTKPVQYCIRVNSNASEQVYNYSGGFYSMNTTVPYNSKQLLFDSYFDDSYAMSIFDYDPIAGKEIWDSSIKNNLYDKSADEKWAKMYLYKNHPITIEQNRIVIVKTDDNMPQLESGFKKNWVWKVKTVENNDNWSTRSHNVEDIVLFKSVNDKLSVRPYMLGSQSIELHCIDRYGNIISNDGGGNIYVK